MIGTRILKINLEMAEIIELFLNRFSKFLCLSCSKFPEFFKTPPTFAFWMNFVRENGKKQSQDWLMGHPVEDRRSSTNEHTTLYILWNINCVKILLFPLMNALEIFTRKTSALSCVILSPIWDVCNPIMHVAIYDGGLAKGLAPVLPHQ